MVKPTVLSGQLVICCCVISLWAPVGGRFGTSDIRLVWTSSWTLYSLHWYCVLYFFEHGNKIAHDKLKILMTKEQLATHNIMC